MPAQDIKILQHKKLDSLSSGSGLVFYERRAFIASDNLNGFVVLDSSDLSWNFYPFRVGEKRVIQQKAIKEDFESAARISINGKQGIIAFGSGSIDVQRDNILIINPGKPDSFRILPAAPFYRHIKNTLGISTERLNLEGCFSFTDSLFLLNRGTNDVLSLGIADLAQMLDSNMKHMPALQVKRFSMPQVEGFPVSFSGACHFKDDRFLFCATVEKTTNWVEDGSVAGSYIGIASTDGRILQLSPFTDSSGKQLLQKLETIEISIPEKNGIVECCALADNDDGSSTWFRFQLRVKN